MGELADSLANISFGPDLLKKFNEAGPYYSSYPTLNRWQTTFDHASYVEGVRTYFKKNPDSRIYLYIHIPFCAKLCWYCICNAVISNDDERMARFTDVLCREIALLRETFEDIGVKPNIREIHLGGGTPSHLPRPQFDRMIAELAQLTDLRALDEFAIEIDPRTVDHDKLHYFHGFGIDRISFGIQDFDPAVQEKINRIQPFEMVNDLLSPEIRRLFSGINFDLLFGLPLQTRETFRKTVALTKQLSPSRVTLIKYAHVPEIRKHMKLIKQEQLPPTDDLGLMFKDAVQSFAESGYLWAGIDHVTRPDDALGRAVVNGTVGRNFGGFTPGRTDCILGLGPTATSVFGPYYFQSCYDIGEYDGAINQDHFPILKGFELGPDDILRREVIYSIHCRQRVDMKAIEQKYNIDFKTYFARELEELEGFVREGMVVRDENTFSVTLPGRFFVRLVCKLFDRFLRDDPVYTIHGP